jgi:hypothetical protein
VTVAGQTVTVTQAAAGTSCSYTLSPTSYTAPVAGGSSQVGVTTTTGCAWSVTGLPSWISTTTASGTGNGTLTLTVQANTGASRSATVTIAGQPFVVTQPAGTACSVAINPSSFSNVPAAGGNTSVTITTTAGCAWAVAGNPSWITASSTTGTGSGTTTITVQANTGAARNSTFQIGGQSFSVSQLAAGCSYTVSPTSIALSSATQSSTISVSTQPSCTSQATSNVSWMQITANPPAGGGNVTFDIDKNTAHDPRTGTITITGQSFTSTVTVTQDGR